MRTQAEIGFTVRAARSEDAAALARLAGQLGYPSSAGQVERRLTQVLGRPEHAVLVAEAAAPSSALPEGSTALAGWIHAFVERSIESDPTVEIGGLVVDETLRGSGAGRLLIERAEQWARSTGCTTVTVRSNVIRERAHAFYQALGYTVVKSQQVLRKTIVR